MHDTHELELVARAAAGDLMADEAIAARDLLASCDACATLAGDLRAIASATRALGAAVSLSAAPPAPRDFRLTEADATRLRRRGFLGLARISHGIGGRARGLGGALAALGLVGLLVSAGVPSMFPGAGGAATLESVGAAAAPEAGDGLSKDTPSTPTVPAPAATDGYALAASGEPVRQADRGPTEDTSAAGGPSPLALGSIAFLVAGLVLLLSSRNRRRASP